MNPEEQNPAVPTPGATTPVAPATPVVEPAVPAAAPTVPAVEPAAAPAAPVAPVAEPVAPAAPAAPVMPAELDLANNGGLSMADSLSSAEGTLTSAGLAANDAVPTAVGLDELSAQDPGVTMSSTEEPLIPAAPAPGSIGSVTSGPAMPTNNDGYNPFAQVNPTGQASSTDVPMGSQPKSERFSMQPGKKSSTLLMVMIGLAALFAVTTIVFLVLWIMAINAPKEVVYKPQTVVETPVVQDVTVKCSSDLAPEDVLMDGLASLHEEAVLNFKAGSLEEIILNDLYTFTDAEAAEAQRTTFEAGVAAIELVETVMGDDATMPMTVSYDLVENLVSLRLGVNVPALMAMDDMTTTIDLPQDDNGEWLLDQASVQAHFEDQGFVCE